MSHCISTDESPSFCNGQPKLWLQRGLSLHKGSQPPSLLRDEGWSVFHKQGICHWHQNQFVYQTVNMFTLFNVGKGGLTCFCYEPQVTIWGTVFVTSTSASFLRELSLDLAGNGEFMFSGWQISLKTHDDTRVKVMESPTSCGFSKKPLETRNTANLDFNSI